MSSRAPELTKYDNEYTILYKYAKFFNQPVSCIVYYMRDEKGQKYLDTIDNIVKEQLTERKNVVQIYQSLKTYNSKLNVTMLKRSIINISGVLNQNLSDQLVEAILVNFKQLDDIIGLPETTINSNRRDIEFIYNQAEADYIANLDTDIERANDIETMHEDFINVSMNNPFFLKTPVDINSAIFSYNPKIKEQYVAETGGTVITPRLGFYIFDLIRVSMYIPYAQYNSSDGSQYAKIYKPGRLDIEPKYRSISSPKDQTQKSDTIYLTLWLGNTGDDFFTAPKESFHTVVLSLVTGQLTANIPFNIRGNKTENESLSTERIQDALHMVTLGVREEIKVRAETKLIPLYQPFQSGAQLKVPSMEFPTPGYPNVQFQIVEHLLIHLCLLDKSFSCNVYSEENAKPFPLKSRIDLHYRPAYSDVEEAHTRTTETYISNSATLSFTLNVKRSSIGESLDVKLDNNESTSVSLQDGYNYIQLNITKADSRDTVNEFLRVIEPLLLIYWDYLMGRRQNILGFYNLLIQQNTFLVNFKRGMKQEKEILKSKTGKARSGTGLADLYENYPDIFGGSYSVKCQNKHVTILKTKEEANNWTNETFTHAGETKNRQYLPFPAPPESTMFFFACSNDDYPYPGVRKNNTGHNEERYPFIPCCFASDQTMKNSKYKQYYLGQKKSLKKTTQERLKRNALLEYKRIAALPSGIEQLLARYSNNIGQLNRLGMPRSQSSFLHAVLYAVSDNQYLVRSSDEEREAYVINMRRHIANTIHTEVLRQELFDMNADDIKRQLADPNIPMDPSLFYRAIEELYDVNIYTFSTERRGNEDLGKIEIPRNKHFHTRPQRLYRKTIIVYKHTGSEAGGLKFHQCDLIIDRREDIDLLLFEESMTEICSNALEDSMKTITWTMPGLDAYYNMYNIIDFGSLLSNSAVSQYIDTNGKARAFTFPYRSSNGVETMTTIMTIPTQPLNIPSSNVFNSVPLEVALSLFKEPVSVVKGLNISGIWFKVIGIDNGIFIRVNPLGAPKVLIDRVISLPEGPPDPLSTVGRSMVEKISDLRKQLVFILQLVRWIFDIGRNTIRRQGSTDYKGYTDKFFEIYIMVSREKVSSDLIYNFSNIKNNLLPEAQTVENAIEYISRNVPGMVQNKDGINKLVMYSQDFNDKIKNEMDTYFLDTFGMSSVPIPEEIQNFYLSYNDFRQQHQVEVFTSIEDLEYWIDSKLSVGDSRFKIHNKLDLEMAITLDPYIYKDLEDNMFIIQNTKDPRVGSSVRVATEWKVNKINIGSEAKPYKDRDIRNMMIFGISSDGNLIPIEDQTNGSEDYIRIVFYGTNENWISGQGGRYGAILEM